MAVTVREGTVPFEHPSLTKACSTWYKVWGDLQSSSTGRPLICLHGGPGACHNYLLPMQQLAYQHGITVVMYDQIGCGNSTHLPEKRLDASFWLPELFMSELENLLQHLKVSDYDLLGQSWGGMLGSQFAIRQPAGLNRLVISNSPASMKLWVESCDALRAKLPEDVETILEKYEKLQDYGNQEYKDAVLFFYQRHFCRIKGDEDSPFPAPVTETLEKLEENDTVYFTMNGPSEFTVIGNLKSWSVTEEIHKISVPTLVLNGEFDEAQAVCVAPFADNIPNARWVTMKDTSHCSHVEKTDLYCETVAAFLKEDAN